MAETGSDELRSSVVVAKTSLSLPTEKCGNHPSELLNMYCSRHQTVCCTVCITLDHTLCSSNVMYIKAAAANVEKSEKYFEVQKELKTNLEILKKYNVERSRDKARLDEEKRYAQAKIHDFKLKLQHQVEILAENAIKEVDRRHELFAKNIVKDMELINSTVARIENQIIKMQRKENECDLFTAVTRGRSLTEECRVLDNEILRSNGQEMIAVNADELVYENLCLQSSIVRFVDVNPQPISTDQAKLCYAKLTKKIEMKDEITEKNCEISNACCLSSGDIVVTDKCNSTVWLLNDSLKVNTKYSIPGKPKQICASVDDSIAVLVNTDYDIEYYIYLFKVENMELVKCREMLLPRSSRGIGIKDNIIVASYGGGPLESTNGRVMWFTSAGVLYDDIRYDHVDKPGKVTFATTSSFLYIVDEKSGLVCYDIQSGDNIFVEPTLKNIKGMCVDKHNRVFLCDKSAQNIVQLTAHGLTVGTLLKKTDGINNVKALCYDHTNERLIVIMNKSTIAVYSINE